MTGVDAMMPLRASVLAENVALPGVIGDISETSAVTTDKLRIFKLELDMFFRKRPPGSIDLPIKRAGDAGTGSSPSRVPVFVRAGVAGDSLCIELPEWIEVIGVSGGACIATGTGGRGEASALLGRVCDDSVGSADSSSTGGT
jgi:hypothetical protein